MSSFKVQIKGLKEVLKRIEAYDKKLAEGVSKELDKGAINIANMARATAPMGKSGALKSTIGANLSDKFNKTVFAAAPYAAYVEFGTGSRVFDAKSGFMFTPEMKAFAREFYVSGMGRMPARPYMFPALEIEKPKIMDGIKKVLFGDVFK